MIKRQPKRPVENRIASLEQSLNLLHSKLDKLLASRKPVHPDEDPELERNETRQIVTQRIGPWKFDVTEYPEVQSNCILSTALGVLFQDIENKNVVPMSWDSANGNEENLVQWLRELAGTYYLAFDESDGNLMLVKAPAGMTDKTQVTQLGKLLDKVCEIEEDEICIGSPAS